MEETAQTPKGAAFTLTVPLEDGSKKVFHIKKMTEDVYNAARSLFDAKKDFDAVRMIIKALQVGGDKVEDLKDDVPAMAGLARMVYKMIEPIECELKKN